MKRLISFLIIIAAFLPAMGVAASLKPRLVVNIVVSQMRYDYLVRFMENMPEGGFRRFAGEGVVFTDARYNFMQTITPATLATLTTGADPSMHGVVATRWTDYTTNLPVSLIDDWKAMGLGSDQGRGQYSALNLTTPTLGDRLREEKPGSRVVSIAVDPVSAVVMGGEHSEVYWVDETRGNWVSSTAYMDELPGWVEDYNEKKVASQYLKFSWNPSMSRSRYTNTSYVVMDFRGEPGMKKIPELTRTRPEGLTMDYPWIFFTPGGNSLVTDFVRQAIQNNDLGMDDATDLINICYDSPRYAGEYFGVESAEIEDMFYRLDRDIAELISFAEQRAGLGNVVFVLTSDHGASDSFDLAANPRQRFNSDQFRVIVNGFMNAQYGEGDWVSDYCDRQLYLNRNLIYMNNLNLQEVQDRVAAFVLQFRGVSHVLTSTALQNSSFSGGYAEKMQNSFYPRRSGDLTINLMPGWIEEAPDKRAGSGSMYEYDTHVPLIILGGAGGRQRVARTVDMRDVAPTLARMMGISRPIASEGDQIEEIVKYYE